MQIASTYNSSELELLADCNDSLWKLKLQYPTLRPLRQQRSCLGCDLHVNLTGHYYHVRKSVCFEYELYCVTHCG